ncbi:NUDIX hydrolase domain-like protein [Dipodascopsis tothii]|uniref:NUDIX hydrolase domain-like protein n=1 Tax=Dipodascopsis tothii TaxID=44089 RepID=UPI0034CF0F09
MSLQDALTLIESRPDVLLEAPNTARRASVAVVIRYAGAGLAGPVPASAAELFARHADSLAEGRAEMLFIKRATRATDRWSGHVALPGGRRDPDDADDVAAAVRETAEEVGLDLRRDAVYVGPLDQRFVTTNWGRDVLMVLCAYVFVLARDDLPLTVQPSEVAAAFWVPLAALTAPAAQTAETVPVGNRIGQALPRPLRAALHASLGDMLFDGVRIDAPSDVVPAAAAAELAKRPLIVWGLTHNVLTDLFDLLDTRSAIARFRFPTFRAWDLRAVLYVVSFAHVRRLKNDRPVVAAGKGNDMNWVGRSVDNYYGVCRTAVVVTFALRAAAVSYAVVRAVRCLRR